MSTEWHTMHDLGSDVQVETFITYLIDMIKKAQNNDDSKLLLYGLVRAHWYQCKNDECLCKVLIQRIDRIEAAIEDEIASRNSVFEVTKIQEQIEKLE